MDETKTMFFTLIWYSGDVDGSTIVAKLSGDHNENVQKLATVGQTIAAVVKGERQTTELASVIKIFDEFPATDYWMSFIETSGQVLLTRALEMSGDDGTKKQLTKYALELFSKVTASGFGLSKTTDRLLRIVDKEFLAQATLLVRQNSVLKRPESGLRSSIRRPRNPHGRPDNRNRTAVS